jgi:uncharacterized protein (DUF58 family)
MLFPPHYLAAINRFSLSVADSPPGRIPGAHLSRSNGSSLEFRDYQPYSAGDDLRRIDWNIYGRTRHLFVRQFERPTAVPVHILTDSSPSMHLENPSRFTAAARVTAAVAAAALSSQSPVQLTIPQANSASPPRRITGRRGLVNVLTELTATRPAGAGIAQSITAFARSLPRREKGVFTILSDFFEDRGIEELIRALTLVPGRLVLIRITQPWDANSNLSGDLQLINCESAAQLRIFADDSTRRLYTEAYNAYFTTLDRFAKSAGARHLTLSASADTLPQLEPLFPGGVLSL